MIELPELLGTGTIRLASDPPELSPAEKVATMLSRRELNTRDRDFADVWVLSRVRAFDAAQLRSAITILSLAQQALLRRHGSCFAGLQHRGSVEENGGRASERDSGDGLHVSGPIRPSVQVRSRCRAAAGRR